MLNIDGREWYVSQMAEPNTWHAGPNQGWTTGVIVRPNLYVTNVEAIEAVSGCEVIASSVTNTSGYTMAAVQC